MYLHSRFFFCRRMGMEEGHEPGVFSRTWLGQTGVSGLGGVLDHGALSSNTSSVGSHLIELPFSFPPLQLGLESSASLDQCGSSKEVEQVHKIWTV